MAAHARSEVVEIVKDAALLESVHQERKRPTLAVPKGRRPRVPQLRQRVTRSKKQKVSSP